MSGGEFHSQPKKLDAKYIKEIKEVKEPEINPTKSSEGIKLTKFSGEIKSTQYAEQKSTSSIVMSSTKSVAASIKINQSKVTILIKLQELINLNNSVFTKLTFKT